MNERCPICSAAPVGDAPPPAELGVGALLSFQCSECGWYWTPRAITEALQQAVGSTPTPPDYIEHMTLEDEGDGDEGDWLLCSTCDGSWRPDAVYEQHDTWCPVPELKALRAMIFDYLAVDGSAGTFDALIRAEIRAKIGALIPLPTAEQADRRHATLLQRPS